MKNRLVAMLLLAMLGLVGCATKPTERVVLLPGADGKVGAVVVHAQGKDVDLSTAYAAVEVGEHKLESRTLNEQEVRRRFSAALDAQPQRAQSFTVYFRYDSTQLTPESNAELDRIKTALVNLPAPEILVIGHTDQVGSDVYNDELSLKRAVVVRNILISVGLPGKLIETIGRGKREPLVQAAKSLAEPKNRRVEIKVR
ncbi:MAG: OmpA family protein [Sulfuricella sp.]|nr:OmpA family protein [Sulfuricella sp.]